MDGQPNVRRDGRELFFFSTRAGGFGQADLYSATRAHKSNVWADPVNLGGNVNSEFAETRPSLAWRGDVLYFGSTRPGEGSTDIYVTRRSGT
jgi:Tol biopolymer transport system component